MLFPQAFAKLRNRIDRDAVLCIRGTVKHRQRPGAQEVEVEVAVDDVEEVEQVAYVPSSDDNVAGSLIVRVRSATKAQLLELRGLLESNPGDYEVVLQFGENGGQPYIPLHRVAVTDDFVRRLKGVVSSCETDLVQHRRRPQPAERQPVTAR
jgi:hypothetical protein